MSSKAIPSSLATERYFTPEDDSKEMSRPQKLNSSHIRRQHDSNTYHLQPGRCIALSPTSKMDALTLQTSQDQSRSSAKEQDFGLGQAYGDITGVVSCSATDNFDNSKPYVKQLSDKPRPRRSKMVSPFKMAAAKESHQEKPINTKHALLSFWQAYSDMNDQLRAYSDLLLDCIDRDHALEDQGSTFYAIAQSLDLVTSSLKQGESKLSKFTTEITSHPSGPLADTAPGKDDKACKNDNAVAMGSKAQDRRQLHTLTPSSVRPVQRNPFPEQNIQNPVEDQAEKILDNFAVMAGKLDEPSQQNTTADVAVPKLNLPDFDSAGNPKVNMGEIGTPRSLILLASKNSARSSARSQCPSARKIFTDDNPSSPRPQYLDKEANHRSSPHREELVTNITAEAYLSKTDMMAPSQLTNRRSRQNKEAMDIDQMDAKRSMKANSKELDWSGITEEHVNQRKKIEHDSNAQHDFSASEDGSLIAANWGEAAERLKASMWMCPPNSEFKCIKWYLNNALLLQTSPSMLDFILKGAVLWGMNWDWLNSGSIQDLLRAALKLQACNLMPLLSGLWESRCVRSSSLALSTWIGSHKTATSRPSVFLVAYKSSGSSSLYLWHTGCSRYTVRTNTEYVYFWIIFLQVDDHTQVQHNQW